MSEMPRISEAEWQVANVIWDNNRIKAHEVIEILASKTEWKPKTIKAFINKLLVKGVIGFEKIGKEYIYYPIIAREECLKVENKSFLEKIHQGALKKMLVSFIDEYKLNNDDIEELQKMLEERKK